MAAPAIGVRRGWAPGPSAQIDWSHPLAQRLECYFLLVGGRQPVDLVQGVTLTLGGNAYVSPLGLNCDATNSNASITTPTHLRLAQQMSIGVGWIKTQYFTSGGAGLFGTTYTSTDTAPYLGYSFDCGTTAIAFSANNGTTLVNSGTSANVIEGYNYAVGTIAASNNTVRLNNGAPLAGATRSGFPSLAAGSKLYMGSLPYITNRACRATFQWAAIWSRVITDADYAALGADPYCFLRY